MGRIFGTDGIRGIANTELSCKLAMNVGRAAAMVVAERIGRKPVFLVGKDTRISSDMLEAALCAGLLSVGADALLAGTAPTPALSCLIRSAHADAGVMLSASHNPYEYNGVKIFGPEGLKLTDAEEFEIEQIVLDHAKPYSIRWGWELGRMSRKEELLDIYLHHLCDTLESGGSRDLAGLRVAVDCSHGSASATARRLFERLGADAVIIHEAPNGVNINRDCGSTHIEKLAEVVKNGSFNAGIAFDGDADRCIAVDETGNIVDGDEILAILAVDMKERGVLAHNTVVATVMSNLGLFKFAEEHGVHLEATKVGDRYVLERMRQKGFNLGGEQSGHVILSDHMTTGDGQLTAITLLSILRRSGKKLSELSCVMTVYPQVTVNIRADAVMKSLLDIDEGAKKLIDEAKHTLGTEGRVLVRASGTEALIRVMIEGKNREEITALADDLAERLRERLSNNEGLKQQEGY